MLVSPGMPGHRKISNEWLFIFLVMFLNALGIYIGRYLRFNSWDVITNPFQLASDITYLIIHLGGIVSIGV